MNPTDPRLLGVEVVADLPILWATLQRQELPATLDRHFPTPLHWKDPLGGCLKRFQATERYRKGKTWGLGWSRWSMRWMELT